MTLLSSNNAKSAFFISWHGDHKKERQLHFAATNIDIWTELVHRKTQKLLCGRFSEGTGSLPQCWRIGFACIERALSTESVCVFLKLLRSQKSRMNEKMNTDNDSLCRQIVFKSTFLARSINSQITNPTALCDSKSIKYVNCWELSEQPWLEHTVEWCELQEARFSL